MRDITGPGFYGVARRLHQSRGICRLLPESAAARLIRIWEEASGHWPRLRPATKYHAGYLQGGRRVHRAQWCDRSRVDAAAGYGVVGIQGPGSYAVYALGNVHVTGNSLEGFRHVQDRPSARSGEQVPVALLRRVARHDEHLQRQRDHRRQRRGDRRTARLLRGAEPRSALPADGHRLLRAPRKSQRR